MKKLLLISSLATFLFASCAKERTCECVNTTTYEDESTGYQWTTQEKFSFKYKSKNKHAEGPCTDGLVKGISNANTSSDDPDIVVVGGNIKCELK
jgi:hypothetical protein